MIYTEQEALEETLDYFQGDDLASSVFLTKYALRDNDGKLLEKNPSDMHRRLAKEFYRIEKKYKNPLSEEDIFNYLDRFGKIIPQGSPMAGIGNNYQIMSLSNCQVIASPEDSIGGILFTDQELAQLQKRRCIREDSFVFIENRGLIKISDVEIGDKILSFDIENSQNIFSKVLDKINNKVEKNKKVSINFYNGTLNTTNDHPICCWDYRENSYKYLECKSINKNYQCLTNNEKYIDINNENDDISWLLGAHIGDGCCNWYKSYKKNILRTRINGDNKNIIKKYSFIFNNLYSKNMDVKIDNRKNYKSQVWKYQSCLNNEIDQNHFINLLDGQIGKKTYTCFIPKYINKDNIVPFLAGLIDTDGYITRSGKIEFYSCSEKLINEIGNWLNILGVEYSIGRKYKVRSNEHPIFKASIYANQIDFILQLCKFMSHETKKEELLNSKYNKYRINRYLISSNEWEKISKNFKNMERGTRGSNLHSIHSLCKNSNDIGSCSIDEFRKNNLISKEDQKSIEKRVFINSVKDDVNNLDYYDLSIEGVNNFYTGNGGLYLVHNCGVGFDVSTIRPKGLSTQNAAKTTDGIAVFLERFSRTTREIAQGGRRGALLLSISIHHPEVETFIKIKQDLSKVTGANISVKFSDEFMQAVKEDKEYEQKWPVDSENPIISKKVNARLLWNLIVDCNWNSAEPGCLFWDTVKRETPAECYKDFGFNHTSVNPCAELILSPYDSCRLIALNLTQFIKNPFTNLSSFDEFDFANTVYDAQKLMDDMIDLEIEHIDKIIEKINLDPETKEVKDIELNLWNKIKKNCINGRRTGLGITGLGDTLASLGYIYGSNESLEMTTKIYQLLAINSYKSSVDMARDRGVFPVYRFSLEKDHVFLNRVFSLDNDLKNKYIKYGRRNIANLTTAPTGSISILARLFNTNKNNITSGIEPAYLLNYTRRRKISGESISFDFIDNLGDKWEETNINHAGFALWKEITQKEQLEDSPYYQSTSNDINWSKSVDIQAAAQKWVCHSLSKTCNIPTNSTKELISEIYIKAWENGCKGFTIYRDGCRSGVLLSKKAKIPKTNAPERPKILPCKIFYPRRKNGIKFIVVVSTLGDDPYELFAWDGHMFDLPNHITEGIVERVKNKHYRLIKDGEVIVENLTQLSDPDQETINRLISSSLRHGMDLKHVIGQLTKVRGSLYDVSLVLARVLKNFIPIGTISSDLCPECDEKLQHVEGCLKCICGYSKC